MDSSNSFSSFKFTLLYQFSLSASVKNICKPDSKFKYFNLITDKASSLETFLSLYQLTKYWLYWLYSCSGIILLLLAYQSLNDIGASESKPFDVNCSGFVYDNNEVVGLLVFCTVYIIY